MPNLVKNPGKGHKNPEIGPNGTEKSIKNPENRQKPWRGREGVS